MTTTSLHFATHFFLWAKAQDWPVFHMLGLSPAQLDLQLWFSDVAVRFVWGCALACARKQQTARGILLESPPPAQCPKQNGSHDVVSRRVAITHDTSDVTPGIFSRSDAKLWTLNPFSVNISHSCFTVTKSSASNTTCWILGQSASSMP